VDLLGAMSVIEGLGTALAGDWARRLREQLGPREDQVRFLRYHGEADDDHFAPRAVYEHAVVCEYAHERLCQLGLSAAGPAA
jgi:hypothetical protein